MESASSQVTVSTKKEEEFKYQIMHYKKSGKHALRRKRGNQLCQHRSLPVIREAWLKLWSGVDEAEVIRWVREQV
jgi:hypothetical protein